MDMGGRQAAYELMGMDPPPLPGPPPKSKAPELRIDRTGEEDENRYSGLKMGTLLDDDAMGEALARANEKSKKGESLRPKLMEEDYELPFAGTCRCSPFPLLLHALLDLSFFCAVLKLIHFCFAFFFV